MAYKFPNTPSSRAYIEELADYWEILVLKTIDAPIAVQDILGDLTIELDEINHDGIFSEDDIVSDQLKLVMDEIDRRFSACSNNYPFNLNGTRLEVNPAISEYNKSIYIFFLLATRFNMSNYNVQNGLDGTLLFEQLCGPIGKHFWGYNTDYIINGTSARGGFPERVGDITKLIKEGEGFNNSNHGNVTKKDDGVDIVLVKYFSDQRPSKLIGLGQCKTGTDWQKTFNKSKIVDFCSNWFRDNPILDPIPIAFISDTLYHQFNDYSNSKGCLIFNRFRLMEYLPDDIGTELYDRILSWVDGALEFVKSPAE
ncbi:MAG: hypothetical protein WAT22_18930 [Saprospiraceae bacterium]